jgi:hypothetical protein
MRHRLLTASDHFIGLEATAATAKVVVEPDERKVKKTEARPTATKKRLRQTRSRRTPRRGRIAKCASRSETRSADGRPGDVDDESLVHLACGPCLHRHGWPRRLLLQLDDVHAVDVATL